MNIWHKFLQHTYLSRSPRSHAKTNHYVPPINKQPYSRTTYQSIQTRYFLLTPFDHVFSNTLKGYNGAVGPLTAVVNMGSVLPPQRKGKLPQYARNRLEEIQQQFDNLEALGVFARPEDLGVTVELGGGGVKWKNKWV